MDAGLFAQANAKLTTRNANRTQRKMSKIEKKIKIITLDSKK